MKRLLYLAVGVFFLCGCSSKFIANKNYPTANIDGYLSADKEFCHDFALGRTPIPQLQTLPQRGYTVQTQGNIQGVGLYPVYYNHTSYIDNTQNYNNVAASNLGSAIGFAIAISRRENECMQRLGWVTKEQMTPEIQQMIAENDKFSANDVQLKKIIHSFSGDPLFDEVTNFLAIQIQNMPPEQRKKLTITLRRDPEKFKDIYAIAKVQYQQILNEIEHSVGK